MGCPVCGGPLIGEGMRWMKDARILVSGDSAVRFTKTEAKLFDFFWQHRNRAYVYSIHQLADHVYCDDPDGGPDSAENCVRVNVCRVRDRIKGLGLTIRATHGRGGGFMMEAA